MQKILLYYKFTPLADPEAVKLWQKTLCDGLNLRVTVPVTFTEAALGATIEVPTLGGDPVKLKVAPGTPSGRVLRVKGRGVHTSKGIGDLLAEVQVVVPSHLEGEAKEALEKFAELEPKESPRADLLAKARA